MTFFIRAKMIRLEDLRVFIHTVDQGSLSAAARLLQLTPAVASSAMARLERELGVRLLIRSTRHLRLSEEGERYLPHARAMLETERQGRHALDTGDGFSGQLRLTLPSGLGRRLLRPWIDEFQQAHPQLSLQLHISDRSMNLFDQPLDAAIRYGVPPDSGLVVLPLAAGNRRVICASPDYIARHGAPSEPAALREHNCLCFVWHEQIHDDWRFHYQGRGQRIAVSGDRTSNDGEIVHRWALDGLGIAYKSYLDVIDDLRTNRLVQLFPTEWCEPAPLHLVCAGRDALSPALRALAKHLRARCDHHLNENAAR
ncbi:LysR family transcriptional regulator [Halotalea alkalilenta]|uniref:LysR family transcriptional regulator n=1 Tax=Halotalea alkalilenta TaxID=376489 RepID=UPI000A722F82|nr:LysR family transcriptional regulator [Halotalea alkalilenta]